MGHEDDVLAMDEALGAHVDTILWDDDDSWAFPILTAKENDGGNLKGKEVEAATPAKKGKKRKARVEAGGSGSGDHHEKHILIERERRKKMRDLFTSLHSLIPHLPPRTDKATIVDEAVEYIQKLQKTLGSLRKQKAQMLGGKTCITTTGSDNNLLPSTLTRNKGSAIRSREAFLAEHASSEEAAAALPNPGQLFSGRPAFPTAFKTWTSPNVILNVFGRDAHINICCPKKPGLLTGISFVLEKHVLEAVSAEVWSDAGGCSCMIHARANGGVAPFPGSEFMVEGIFKQAAFEIMVLIQNQCF